MKKSAIAVLLMLLLALGLSACGSETTTSEDTGAETTSEEIQQPEDAAETTESVDTGNFQITIKDGQFGKDYEGNDAFIVGLNWTNNYKDAQMASVVLTIKAYQDGVEMDPVYFLDGEDIPMDAADKSIQPGASQDIYYAFLLTGSTSDITVEAEEWLGGDGKAVKDFTFTDIQ